MLKKLISIFLFNRVTPMLLRGRAEPHTLGSLSDLPEDNKSRKTSEELILQLKNLKGKPRRVLKALFRIHKVTFARSILLMQVHILSQLITPLLVRSLVGVLAEQQGAAALNWDPFRYVMPQDPYWTGICLAILIYICSIINVGTVQHAFVGFLMTASKIKSSLTYAIYQKALRVSREEKQLIPNGQIVNLMAADVSRLHMLSTFIHSPFSHPIQITLVLYALYCILGWASMVGAAVMLTLLCFSLMIARINASFRRKLLKVSDRRISLINEILTYIRVIKLYGWERSFQKQVEKLRNREAVFLRRIAIASVFISSLFQSAPVLITAATFSTMAYLGEIPALADMFAAIALYSVLRFSMSTFPETIVMIFDSLVSLRRLDNFFSLPEYSPSVQDQSLPRGSVVIQDCTLQWDKDNAALKNINLNVSPGEFICVVGTTGSGKTALLLSVLGELNINSGNLRINGDVGYIAQHPWIVNDTIKNNITLGQPEDARRYYDALDVSALVDDLRIMPEGDSTEIGERGINLSGGQKQRVNIARAVYSFSDIMLLDDPFSGLDPEVRDYVFKKLLKGPFERKTVILCTHLPEIAEQADKVIVMHRGSIAECGTPAELLARGTHFNALKASLTDKKLQEVSLLIEETSMSIMQAEEKILEEANEATDYQKVTQFISEEERRTGSVDKEVYLKYTRVFSPGIILPLIFIVFILKDAVQIANDGWLSYWSQGHVQEFGDFLNGYVILALLVVLFTISRTAIVRLRGLVTGTLMHKNLLRGILNAPITFFDRNPVGRILSRFSGDIESVDSVIPQTLQEVLSSGCAILAAIILVSVVNPPVLLALPLIAYFYLNYQKIFRPNSREIQRIDSITRSPVFAQYSETLSGLLAIRAFKWENIFTARILNSIDDNQKSFYAHVSSNRWLGIRMELMGSTLVFFAAIVPAVIGSYFGAAGSGLGLVYAMAITGAMNWFVRMTTQLESVMNSVERIDYYTNIESEKWEGTTAGKSWPAAGSIEFKDLQVRYREGSRPVLRGISAVIKGGERIGIAGRTGAGKSTIVLALGRLVEPASGDILIDGVSTLTLPLQELREAIAVIPQDPIMFLGTLRSNLDPFEQFDDQEIWESLSRTHIDKFIKELPEGLSTEVHEGGSNFSAGQRQLICLARALLRQNKIIVLDEATANVDAKTDALIQETVKKEFKGKTILTIAHRLSTILDYDRVMILDNGLIAEFDKADTLISTPGSKLREMLSY